jgi:IS5 family transposase
MVELQNFGDYLAFGRLRSDSFLNRVERLINWKPIAGRLRQIYRTGFRVDGRPAWDALVMFKILLLQKWYGLSDPQMEESLMYDIRFIRFSGLSLEEGVPDHSTICRFRQRLRERGLDEVLLEMIIKQFNRKGLLVKTGVIADATLIRSSRRPRKVLQAESERVNEEEDDLDGQSPDITDNTDDSDCDDIDAEYSATDVVYSDDPDADWKVMGKNMVYGYAGHLLTDSETGLVLAAEVTPASYSESKQLEPLIEKLGLEPGTRVYADKGFSGEPNREVLKGHRLKNGIMYRAARGSPLSKRQKDFNKKVSQIRYVIERTFGGLKHHFGQRRARYVGLGRTAFDLRIASIAYNIKRAVNLIPAQPA